MTRWRIKHVLIAAVLLVIELALGLGMIGIPVVITLVAKRFGYDATRPTLYFPAAFHGVSFYDFDSA